MTDAASDIRSSRSGRRSRTRCLAIGNCSGFPELLDLLNADSGVEVIGADGARPVADDRVGAVLLASGGGPGWLQELRSLREHTDAPVLLVSSTASPDMLDEALDAGIEDVVVLPEPVENVLFAIRRAASRAGAGKPADSLGSESRILTVFSPKGGVGKTVLATNLAATLAKHLGKHTLLIDLDLQFGDAAILLGVQPERTLSDLVAAPGELTAEKLAIYVTKHPSGLDILAAPLRPESSEAVTDESLAQVLEAARASYEAIVIDTAPLFHGPILTGIDWTDTLLVVCSPDVASLKNVHLSLRTLSLLSFPSERMRIVLNSAHAGGGLRKREVEAALGMKIASDVPYDKSVRSALNRGVAVSLAGGKSGVAAAVRQLAETLVPVDASMTTRRGGIGGRGTFGLFRRRSND